VAQSTTTNQDNRIVNSDSGIVAAPSSTLVLPGASNIEGNKGTTTVSYQSADNRVDNSVINQFTPEVRDSLNAALELAGTMSAGVMSSAGNMSALTSSIAAGLQTIVSDHSQSEQPNYTKYIPYAILAVIAVMLFRR